MSVTQHPKSFAFLVKGIRRRAAVFPCGHHEARGVMALLIELCDAVLLNEGDSEIQNELAVQHARLNARLPENVVMVPPTQQMGNINQPVIMIAPGEELPHEVPQIVQKPSPDVVMSQTNPTASPMGMPQGFQTLPQGSNVPSTGSVRMVKNGEDPIKAMDDENLTVPS